MRPAPTSRAPRHALRRARNDDGGYTLIELLVAMSMFVVVMMAVFASMEFATKSNTAETERNVSLSDETTGAAQIVSELRRAYSVNAPLISEASKTISSSYIDVNVHIPGVGSKRLFINCGYKEPGTNYDECVRYITAVGSGTAGTEPTGVAREVLVPRVLNESAEDTSDPVFTELSASSSKAAGCSSAKKCEPVYGKITIHTPSKGSYALGSLTHQVQLTDAIFMPNVAAEV